MGVSKNSERIILVTGATGRQGAAVRQHLQKKGFKLRAGIKFNASLLDAEADHFNPVEVS